MKKPNKFVTLKNPIMSHDGSTFAVTVATDGGDFDLSIPCSEIGAIIEFLAKAANYGTPQGKPPEALSPIPVQGLALAHGATPDQTLLIVRLAATDLAFALDSSKVAALDSEFSRILQALSAPTHNPN